MDESAFPWQADWYRQKVAEQLKDKADNYFRLWYVDNALHGDTKKDSDKLHIIGYLNMLYKALIDVSKWVEEGEAPADNTPYIVSDGQVSIPSETSQRIGLQPVITLKANDGEKASIISGSTVLFTANIYVPDKEGSLLSAEWVFDDSKGPQPDETLNINGREATLSAKHEYNNPGTYYAVLRTYACPVGRENDIFPRVGNLARVRIIVQ
jgi:hypothetical protein